MYISAKLDKSTEVTHHITTTLLPSTHFAEVPLEQGLRGLTPLILSFRKENRKETIYYYLSPLDLKT
jgi:hypothetical protein